MRALTVTEYGGSLLEAELERPKASPGHVIVRNRATSFNPIDAAKSSGMLRQAFPLEFPWVPGGDISGTVHEIGDGVSAFKAGDEIFGYSSAGGAYAEFVAVNAVSIALRPPALDVSQGAAVAVVSQTAMQSLDLARLKAGARILIHGGAGGVGTLAIQLAHQAGAKVFTTAQEKQRKPLLELGADVVIDFTKENIEDAGEPFDAILALIGGETLDRSYAFVKRGGVIVTFTQPPDPEQCERQGIQGFFVQTQVRSEGLTKFAERVESGKIVPVIAVEETLWNPAAIWKQRPSGIAVGKVVFTL